MTLLADMYQRSLLRTWLRDQPEGWELTSGDWSPFYFSFRDVPSYPTLMKASVELLAGAIESSGIAYDKLLGVASTGAVLCGAVAHEMGVPMAFTRSLAGVRKSDDVEAYVKEWGGHSLIEGALADGDRLFMVDDVIATSAAKERTVSLVESVAASRQLTLPVVGIAVAIDRSGGRSVAAPAPVVSGVMMHDAIGELTEAGATDREIGVIGEYLREPLSFQDGVRIKALMAEGLVGR